MVNFGMSGRAGLQALQNRYRIGAPQSAAARRFCIASALVEADSSSTRHGRHQRRLRNRAAVGVRSRQRLASLRPDLAPQALHQRARTVFAAVHGMVMLALTARFVATPRDQLPGEVAALVEAMTRGLAE